MYSTVYIAHIHPLNEHHILSVFGHSVFSKVGALYVKYRIHTYTAYSLHLQMSIFRHQIELYSSFCAKGYMYRLRYPLIDQYFSASR